MLVIFFLFYMMAAKLHCFIIFLWSNFFLYERTNKGRGGNRKRNLQVFFLYFLEKRLEKLLGL